MFPKHKIKHLLNREKRYNLQSPSQKQINLIKSRNFKTLIQKATPVVSSLMVLLLVGFGLYTNKTNSQVNQDLDKFLMYPSLKNMMQGTTEVTITDGKASISSAYAADKKNEEAILQATSTITTAEEFVAYLEENEENPILVASAAPFEIYTERSNTDDQGECEFLSHTVSEGETIEQIAETFGLSANTILWANELKPTDLIQPGMELSIPCLTDAALHTVRSGETLSQIATLHDVSIEKIMEFNNLETSDDISEGQRLIIPDSILVKELQTRLAAAEAREREAAAQKAAADAKAKQDAAKKAAAQKTAAKKRAQPSAPKKVTSRGYYILPVQGRVSYRLHNHNAIDISMNNGYPVMAAASGTITKAQCGWNGGYGCIIDIKHANGTLTRYAHLARGGIYVRAGQRVSQGKVIGKVGSTGRSTGPHLHFEVHGARNPYLR